MSVARSREFNSIHYNVITPHLRDPVFRCQVFLITSVHDTIKHANRRNRYTEMLIIEISWNLIFKSEITQKIWLKLIFPCIYGRKISAFKRRIEITFVKSQQIHRNGILDLVQTQYAGTRYLPIIHSPLFCRVFNSTRNYLFFTSK